MRIDRRLEGGNCGTRLKMADLYFYSVKLRKVREKQQ